MNGGPPKYATRHIGTYFSKVTTLHSPVDSLQTIHRVFPVEVVQQWVYTALAVVATKRPKKARVEIRFIIPPYFLSRLRSQLVEPLHKHTVVMYRSTIARAAANCGPCHVVSSNKQSSGVHSQLQFDTHVFRLSKKSQRLHPTFPTHPRLLHAAKRRPQIPEQPTVHPDNPRLQ